MSAGREPKQKCCKRNVCRVYGGKGVKDGLVNTKWHLKSYESLKLIRGLRSRALP